MQVIALSAVPNQTFSVTTPDGTRYAFAVYLANGFMCYDVAVNEVQQLTGERIVNGTFLIAYFGLEGNLGNFILLTQAENLPDFTQFGTTQTLIYMTFAEIQAAVAAAPAKALPVPTYAVAS